MQSTDQGPELVRQWMRGYVDGWEGMAPRYDRTMSTSARDIYEDGIRRGAISAFEMGKRF